MLDLYSIMHLDKEHIDEICEDIKSQYQNGITTCALFCMTLVPEGNPVVNKAAEMCSVYDLYRKRLSPLGIPNGVLVQASIGHGWVLSEMFPYMRYTNLTDGEKINVVCPYDDGFKEYIYHAMRTIAQHNPDCIMLDDDFRLIGRNGSGCACPLHMKLFNEIVGTAVTREELSSIIFGNSPLTNAYTKAFVEVQRESLTETAKIMRKGIDSINPDIPCSFCCVGNNAEFANEIAAILAGKGKPVTVRINNGSYTAAGSKYISYSFHRAAAQIAKLKGKADKILAETDTCPQNRYSTSAMYLHSHFTGSILEGAVGAKHWITRRFYEPESGKAYRKILSKNRGFYEALVQAVSGISWQGFRIPVLGAPSYSSLKKPSNSNMELLTNIEPPNGWSHCVLERLGLPMYFSAENGGVLCLEGEADKLLTNEEICQALKKSVILASDSAENIIKRGFGEYIGVSVKDWKGDTPSYEKLSVNGNLTSVQYGLKELVIKDKAAEVHSWVIHSVNNKNSTNLFPGSVTYKNKHGGLAFIYCGTPKTPYHISTAFSFLNSSRKKQLAKVLERAGELPLYYPNDEEVYLRAGKTASGETLCAIFNIGFDPIEKLELCITNEVHEIQKLMPNGTRCSLKFKKLHDRYGINTECNPLDPVVLFIK